MKALIRKLIPQKIRLLILQNYIKIKYSHRIKQFKNKYKGKRCFIIGNGPSLVKKDLDKLENEYTFAANMIYHSFKSTKWRPTFYTIADIELCDENVDEIKNLHPDYDYGFFVINRLNLWHGSKMESNPKNFFFMINISTIQMSLNFRLTLLIAWLKATP